MTQYIDDSRELEVVKISDLEEDAEYMYDHCKDFVEKMDDHTVVPFEAVRRYFQIHEGFMRRTADNERAVGFYERNGNIVNVIFEMFMDEDTGKLYVTEMEGLEIDMNFQTHSKLMGLANVCQAKQKDAQRKKAEQMQEKMQEAKEKAQSDDGGLGYIG